MFDRTPKAFEAERQRSPSDSEEKSACLHADFQSHPLRQLSPRMRLAYAAAPHS
jgi:hypothetical protein